MNLETRQVDTGTGELLCEIRERVAILTLNRPEARNALSDSLSPALRRMIAHCATDDTVGAVVLTATGTSFCAGGDVKGMGGRSAKRSMSAAERTADLRERERQMTGALVAMRKPTIAALPGPAIGAGLAIALACDLRIAASSAFVATGYARIGLSGDYGIAWLLTRLVGTARARELMYVGERVDAQRAEMIGLVNRVVPDEELADEAFALARQLANGPGRALQFMKDNLDDALVVDFDQALVREAERLVRAAQTADHAEAVQAFVEKRAPRFSGA